MSLSIANVAAPTAENATEIAAEHTIYVSGVILTAFTPCIIYSVLLLSLFIKPFFIYFFEAL